MPLHYLRIFRCCLPPSPSAKGPAVAERPDISSSRIVTINKLSNVSSCRHHRGSIYWRAAVWDSAWATLKLLRKTAFVGVISTLCLTAGAEAALPQPDPASILTIKTENDIVAHTDQNYTAGLRLGWTSPTVDKAGGEFLPRLLTDFGELVWGAGRQRISIDLSNAIYTPKDTTLTIPDPRDRPYAGVLLATASLLHDTTTSRSVIGISAGILGPSARSSSIQNGWHEFIGEEVSKGWDYQIKDMAIAEAFVSKVWRFGLTPNPGTGIDIDVLPSAAAGLGTLRNFAQVGFQLRIGQGLDSDFGTARIRPGLSGSDAYTPTREFAWYVFAGGNGRAVGWDATLDGNPFRTGPHVSRQPFVGEVEAGFAVIYRGVRLTYTHVAQTQSFHGQRSGWFQFGSIAAAVRF